MTTAERGEQANELSEVAVLGGGCFWCLDAVFRRVQGVTRVQSGYAGGHLEAPSYAQVCGGDTGHAEVVRVVLDPQVVSYRELLEIFFGVHDPTTKDRQGADVGPQYRSVILTLNDRQERTAFDLIAELQRQDLFGAKIVTEVERLTTFWPAEEVHQDYFARNPGQGYCAAVIAPKVATFRQRFSHRLREEAPA